MQSKDLRNEGAEPEALLGGVSSGDVLGFSGGKNNNFLLLRIPKDRAATNDEGKSRDRISNLTSQLFQSSFGFFEDEKLKKTKSWSSIFNLSPFV
jgi:hypothetical protein